jgi:hypothetical protein
MGHGDCWKTKDSSAPRPNSFPLIECNVEYAAWLLRPQALGASVAMTVSKFILPGGYTNPEIVLVTRMTQTCRLGSARCLLLVHHPHKEAPPSNQRQTDSVGDQGDADLFALGAASPKAGRASYVLFT